MGIMYLHCQHIRIFVFFALIEEFLLLYIIFGRDSVVKLFPNQLMLLLIDWHTETSSEISRYDNRCVSSVNPCFLATDRRSTDLTRVLAKFQSWPTARKRTNKPQVRDASCKYQPIRV